MILFNCFLFKNNSYVVVQCYMMNNSAKLIIIVVKSITINICVVFIFCIFSFLFMPHTPPGQCFACPGYIRLYILQPIQIPNDVSKNKSIRQKKHIPRLINPLTSYITNRKNIISDNANPMLHANLFCGAPTYSTSWVFTNSLPKIRLGEYFGFMNTLMVKSIKKAVTNIFMKLKFPMNQAFENANTAKKKSIPAPALASRSFNTLTLYPLTFSPK